MAKGCNVLSGSKTEYPVGYKMKTGSLGVKSGKYTIPENIIPLVIKTSTFNSGTDGGYTGGGCYLQDSNGRNYISTSGSYQGTLGHAVWIDIVASNNNDYSIVKSITSFTSAWHGKAPSVFSFEIVKWLEKL